jgi:hypothetical protein
VEPQFGHVFGEAGKDQVLIIKTALGGKRLDADSRPPSAGGQVGAYDTKMIDEIQTAPKNPKTDFPSYNGHGYQLEGCVWSTVIADLAGSWMKTSANAPQAALDLKSAQKAVTARRLRRDHPTRGN